MLPPFQAFLDAHRADVYRFLRAQVGPEEADDCFQETFLAALRSYPKLTSTENLRAWVLRTAYRKAVDEHRARGRRPRPAARLPEGRVAAPSDPDTTLWRSVQSLPAKQRAAVLYRFVNDLPYKQIAALMETSEEAARRSVHEGIKKLQEVLCA